MRVQCYSVVIPGSMIRLEVVIGVRCVMFLAVFLVIPFSLTLDGTYILALGH